MISIEGLVTGYGGEPVLKGVDAFFGKSAVHGLIGLNGSGKTTLLRSLYNMVKPVKGKILIDGMPPDRKAIAFLEAEQYFYHNITGAEYLSLLAAPSFDKQSWLDIFSLPGDVMVDEYSTGMKKKLAFIGVMALNRKILLLDEPFNGLDMESSRILAKVLLKLKQKERTIIITSHILGSLTGICDSMLLLKDGLAHRTYTDVTTTEIEQEVFQELDISMDAKLEQLSGL